MPIAVVRSKLGARGFEAETIEAAIAEFSRAGLLDDVRYAQRFVEHRAHKGDGPRRITQSLQHEGLPPETIRDALATVHDWPTRAKESRLRKFGSEAPTDVAERARQARFLQYRGFSADHIRSALGIDVQLDE